MRHRYLSRATDSTLGPQAISDPSSHARRSRRDPWPQRGRSRPRTCRASWSSCRAAAPTVGGPQPSRWSLGVIAGANSVAARGPRPPHAARQARNPFQRNRIRCAARGARPPRAAWRVRNLFRWRRTRRAAAARKHCSPRVARGCGAGRVRRGTGVSRTPRAVVPAAPLPVCDGNGRGRSRGRFRPPAISPSLQCLSVTAVARCGPC